MEWFTIAGLVLDAAGVLTIASAALVTKERAVELGVMRIAGDTTEENLRLPAVQALLSESRRTFWGLLLIALGFVLQIVGNWPT